MTVVENPARRPRRQPVLSHVSLVLALGLVLAACSKEQAVPQDATTAPTAAPAVSAENAVSAKLSSMSPEQLRAAASKAYSENRLFAPAADNALEYYLALHEKQPGEASVSSALTDLLPMTVIAIEQSVARDDFADAQRLAALLEKADPQHAALARLKASIGTQQQAVAKRTEQQLLTAEQAARKQVELDKKRLADQQKLQELATMPVAAPAAADSKRIADQQAAEQRVSEQRATEQRAVEQRATEQRAAQQRPVAAAPPPAAAPVQLRALSTPSPKFPPEALRAGQSGEVQVEFTVGTDGSVTAARVVRADPQRVFDREAINAVRRWRFQPVDAPVTARRTIGFKPGG